MDGWLLSAQPSCLHQNMPSLLYQLPVIYWYVWECVCVLHSTNLFCLQIDVLWNTWFHAHHCDIFWKTQAQILPSVLLNVTP